MSELKFECPHCGQHIAADETCGGSQIACPLCQGAMLVPRLARVGSEPLAETVTLATDVRGRRLYAAPVTLDPWTEEAWNRHVAEMEAPGSPGFLDWTMVLWLSIMPALVGVLFGSLFFGKNSAGWPWLLWLLITVVCSLLCAVRLAREISDNIVIRMISTVGFGVALFGLNLSIAVFLGCTAGAMSAAAHG